MEDLLEEIVGEITDEYDVDEEQIERLPDGSWLVPGRTPIDEHGGTAGLVTMEDLLEEIVGEITDEYDTDEPRVERLPNGALRVPGRTPIDEVNELLGCELPQEEWDTVGGLVFNALGHVPTEGECARVSGLEFCAERMQGRRIVSVRITRLKPRVEEAPRPEAPAVVERRE
jgi:CBS domain containing-hemolysin-like protein